MGTHVQDLKLALRRHVRQRLAAMTATGRAEGSARARLLLAAQPGWQAAESILFFAPLPEELDVWPLLLDALTAGKTVALPRFAAETQRYRACRVEDLSADVASGQFGIREPVAGCPELSLNRLDFILAPGIAFDLQGRRLGRGKGHYDHLLAAARGRSCGVAYDEQIVNEIPVEPHDANVNCLLTPTRWLEL